MALLDEEAGEIAVISLDRPGGAYLPVSLHDALALRSERAARPKDLLAGLLALLQPPANPPKGH
jgi:hypothetical protein